MTVEFWKKSFCASSPHLNPLERRLLKMVVLLMQPNSTSSVADVDLTTFPHELLHRTWSQICGAVHAGSIVEGLTEEARHKSKAVLKEHLTSVAAASQWEPNCKSSDRSKTMPQRIIDAQKKLNPPSCREQGATQNCCCVDHGQREGIGSILAMKGESNGSCNGKRAM